MNVKKTSGFWSKTHHLDRMTFRELVIAYLQYPAIILYLGLALAGIGVWAWRPAPLGGTLLAIGAAVLLFPVVWYVLHRWVLHSRWMWKIDWLAATWKRIHYDHHQDPNNLAVLFGSPVNVVPTVAVATIPIGYAIAGPGGAAAAFATGMIQTCVNELFHCVQHLSYKPRNSWLMHMKMRHMEHHFHDESGNFGITNFWWDRLFATYYAGAAKRSKSATVFNLGYTEEVARSYPKVRDLSGGVVATGHPATRIRDKAKRAA
ncbi:sterol desaturase family protein [Sphingomonas morindae]|uniref:Sterol desaturase family protein n=1 Tax=Sphingomonas morindae TaxID=1541170 RepID=A0ABY4X8C6_9SPHN|nr:sterol desaturase family protein [Sphingomonas morindae]USI73199.1 sterol desaturase family protein [Sphingomonas morindae]